MDKQNIFWQASSDDIKQGYIFDCKKREYICLICGKRYEDGFIYDQDGHLCAAEQAIKLHIESEHGSIFNFLLKMGKAYTGLTEKQSDIMQMIYDGMSDKEIANKTGATNTSTIRNQRFGFKEKYKQAKITVSLYELLEESKDTRAESRTLGSDSFIDFHRTTPVIDERFAITQTERDDVLKRYFDTENKLIIKNFPSKEKKKIIILQRIMESFESNRMYSEKEVNLIIKNFYEDIPSIRRCLIEYGFLDRTESGHRYWVKH